jgi:hypothetical protein
MLLVNMCSK